MPPLYFQTMKSKSLLLLATALGLGALSSLQAQTTPNEPKLGMEKPANLLAHVQVENLQGQTLGRISELGVDLVNGRIVEVLIVSGDFLDIGGKITAVPATALIPDADRKISASTSAAPTSRPPLRSSFPSGPTPTAANASPTPTAASARRPTSWKPAKPPTPPPSRPKSLSVGSTAAADSWACRSIPRKTPDSAKSARSPTIWKPDAL